MQEPAERPVRTVKFLGRPRLAVADDDGRAIDRRGQAALHPVLDFDLRQIFCLFVIVVEPLAQDQIFSVKLPGCRPLT